MFRALATVLLFTSLLPAQAEAQTLTVEIDAVLEPGPAVLPVAPPATVLVRPLEDELPYPPARRLQEAPPPAVRVVAASPPQADDEPEIEAWGGIGSFVESLDLSGADLVLDEPEIGALRGLHLSPDWAGNEQLRDAIVGGAEFHVGTRIGGIFRGPELRIALGGGDLDGAFNAVDGAPDGMELAVRSIFLLRVELAAGLQLELGPITLYGLAFGSVGGAWIDVAVRDARLGELGTETIGAELFSAGLEAGIDVEVERGMELGLAFRANLVGSAPGLGGALRVSWGGE